jgi:hypothetical protein
LGLATLQRFPSGSPSIQVAPAVSLPRFSDLVVTHPEFGELLIDLEEDNAARAVVFGLLKEMERR